MDATTRLLHDSHLENPGTPEFQLKLFQAWDRSNGQIDDIVRNCADDLVLFGMPMARPVPDLLSAGSRSLAGRVMGSGWRNALANDNLSDVAGRAYIAAAEGNPVLEHMNCKTTIQGNDYCLDYTRLVLRCLTTKGFPYLVTYSHLNFLTCGAQLLATHRSLSGSEHPTKDSAGHVLLGEDSPIAAAPVSFVLS